MSLGPIIGGMLYGSVDIKAFYPLLAITVPLVLVVFWINRHSLTKQVQSADS